MDSREPHTVDEMVKFDILAYLSSVASSNTFHLKMDKQKNDTGNFGNEKVNRSIHYMLFTTFGASSRITRFLPIPTVHWP